MTSNCSDRTASAGVAADPLDNAQKLAAKGRQRGKFEVDAILSLNQSPEPHLSAAPNINRESTFQHIEIALD
jgi:hypothetical protein